LTYTVSTNLTSFDRRKQEDGAAIDAWQKAVLDPEVIKFIYRVKYV
jgi:hypothetical protein